MQYYMRFVTKRVKDCFAKNKKVKWVMDLVVDKNFDHVTQRIPQQHVVVASVAELIEGEFDRSLDAALYLNDLIIMHESLKNRNTKTSISKNNKNKHTKTKKQTVSSALILISSATIVQVT